jgi:hypothetical protein
MKRWFRDRKAHIDEAKVAQKAQDRRDVRDYADAWDEDSYVALERDLNPDITPDELERKIALFRELCRIRALSAAQRPPS